MSQIAAFNSQIVSEIDALADFWKAAAAIQMSAATLAAGATVADEEPTRAPAKRKRATRSRKKSSTLNP
jgi:hypothetical protein